MRTALAVSISLLCLAASATALAQDGPGKATPLSAAERAAVVATLGQQLKTNYVFPELANKIAAQTAAKLAKGGYDAATTTEAMAEALTSDLVELGKDKHFRVGVAPGFEAPPAGAPQAPSAAKFAEMRKELSTRAYGIERVQRLPGNVGYLEVRGFGPAAIVGSAYTSAMSLLAGTDALVLDLRRNGGGEPESVAHLLSHFFAEGDERHLNDIYTRPTNATREYWTNPAVTVRYTRPIYVLTSGQTFSGGEEAAYDLQTQKRATLVGEPTGGGANPGDDVALGHDLVAFIPTGRAINPVTKTNWEHVGVKPDVAVPAAAAMKTAYVAILTDLVAKATAGDERESMKDLLARVQKDEVDLPKFVPRRR
jgi:hypothetical protein